MIASSARNKKNGTFFTIQRCVKRCFNSFFNSLLSLTWFISKSFVIFSYARTLPLNMYLPHAFGQGYIRQRCSDIFSSAAGTIFPVAFLPFLPILSFALLDLGFSFISFSVGTIGFLVTIF